MSSYLYFYVKGADRFYPLLSVSRNHPLYKYFSNVPYEKVCAVSFAQLEAVSDAVDDAISRENEYLQRREARKQLVATFNNSIEEKNEEIFKLEEEELEIKEEINELRHAGSIAAILYNAISCAMGSNYGEEGAQLNPDQYIYAGFETGYNPSFEDIVE